jgi:hypothetical protein|tara:strand:+ start:130 stop:237 length:108 start_codon:yes stop_codon:yes gene_type:complete
MSIYVPPFYIKIIPPSAWKERKEKKRGEKKEKKEI